MTATTIRTPATISASCSELMSWSSSRSELRLGREFECLGDVHGDHAGNTGIRPRYADQLVRHLHRDLVVRDEQELRFTRHLLHHLAEAVRVRVVEWRVDFVHQAERRGIELEQREDQRDRRQRLLAARKLVDRRIALARRMRDYLHARIENFLAGQQQLRLTAAEERRKELREIGVDDVERLLQQLARLAVDLPDRGLERRHRLGEIGRLPIEVALALGRLRKLVEG